MSKPTASGARNELRFAAAFAGRPPDQVAYAELLRSVFGFVPADDPGMGPMWCPFAYFEPDGSCVAGVEVAKLDLLIEGRGVAAAGVRLVGVAERRRGQGLFRALMEHALRWSEQEGVELVLLYTEDHALYRRFGFEPVPQYMFVGPSPEPIPTAPAQAIDGNPRRSDLVLRILPSRRPLSRQVALVDAPALFLDKMSGDDGFELAYLPDLDALIVFEIDDETLILADVASPAIPNLAQILGALPRRFARVTILFPPDQLGWAGTSVADDTGLMVRGALPPAMRRPFRLPPTTEF